MTREQIDALLTGLDGVTPGPWIVEGLNRSGNFSVAWKPELKVCQTYGDSVSAGGNAAHIARCDPDTIRALCELALEGLALRAENAEQSEALDELTGIEEEAIRLRAENERLRKAGRFLKPYLVWTIGSESPGHHPTMPSAVAAFLGALERKPE
jgi:hypothetical protein